MYLHEFFDRLVEFSKSLDEEDKRTVSEKLPEEELALFDLLTKPDPALTRKQEIAVKKVAEAILAKLKKEKLVLDWRKRQQTRQAVRLCIEQELDKLPEDAYPKELYEKKCELTYRHVFECYQGDGKSINGKAAWYVTRRGPNVVDFRSIDDDEQAVDPTDLATLYTSLDRKSLHVTPRPPQTEAFGDLSKRRSCRDRVLKMSTGYGKTDRRPPVSPILHAGSGQTRRLPLPHDPARRAGPQRGHEAWNQGQLLSGGRASP